MSGSELSFHETDHDDLTTGRSPWGAGLQPPARAKPAESFKVDVAIVGAGITGSLVAEHLTALGHDVAVLDREQPGFGSTRASTAMLQWETDSTLGELTELYGFETAADVYRRSRAAAAGLYDLVAGHHIACAFRHRPTLYLAAGETDERALRTELALRHRAGLPGEILTRTRLKEMFGFEREAAILSPGAAEADPLLLSWSLLRIAAGRGAAIVDADALHFHADGRRVVIETSGPHVIDARHVVLATGYAMPHFAIPSLHRISSSFALATVPQDPARRWRDSALVWEAAEPYLYARLTADNRIVIGGEDEAVADPEVRDAMLAEKTMRLRARLLELVPDVDATISHAWCGAFGETDDGLPLIGPVPGMANIHAAYGYGGNGITFSYLASRLIAAMIAGERQAWFENFALDRVFKTYS